MSGSKIIPPGISKNVSLRGLAKIIDGTDGKQGLLAAGISSTAY